MKRSFWIFLSCFLSISLPAIAQEAPLFDPESDVLSMTPEEKEVLYDQAWELLDDIEILQREVVQLRSRVRELTETIRDYQEKLWVVSIASTPARYYAKQLKLLEPELKKATEMLEASSQELQVKMIALGIIEQKLLLVEDEVAGPLLEAMSKTLLSAEEAQVSEVSQVSPN